MSAGLSTHKRDKSSTLEMFRSSLSFKINCIVHKPTPRTLTLRVHSLNTRVNSSSFIVTISILVTHNTKISNLMQRVRYKHDTPKDCLKRLRFLSSFDRFSLLSKVHTKYVSNKNSCCQLYKQ